MKPNYNGNKKRREEKKRKKHEEKLARRQNRKNEAAGLGQPQVQPDVLPEAGQDPVLGTPEI